MKPWEETWRQSEAYPTDVFGEDGGDVLFEGAVTNGATEEEVAARAKLAAEAPTMAMLLLELEWSGGDRDEPPDCPVCGGHQPTHEPGCRLDALFRRIGQR